MNQNRIKLWGAFKNSGIAIQEVSEMLYLAYVKNKARFPDESELVAKSQPAFVRQYLGLKWPEPHLYYAMFNTEMRSLVRPRCSLSLASSSSVTLSKSQ